MNNSVSLTWFSFTAISGTIASSILSYFVYKKVQKNSPHRYYAAVLICMAIWCFDSFLIGTFPYNKYALFFARLFHLGGIYAPFFFILWIFGIGKNDSKVYKLYKIFAMIMVLILSYLNFRSELLIKLVNYNHFFTPFHSAGKYYHIFVLFLYVNGIVGCLELNRNIRLEVGIKKIQLSYILLAAIVMYTAGTVYFLYTYNFRIWPITDIFLFPACHAMDHAGLQQNCYWGRTKTTD